MVTSPANCCTTGVEDMDMDITPEPPKVRVPPVDMGSFHGCGMADGSAANGSTNGGANGANGANGGREGPRKRKAHLLSVLERYSAANTLRAEDVMLPANRPPPNSGVMNSSYGGHAQNGHRADSGQGERPIVDGGAFLPAGLRVAPSSQGGWNGASDPASTPPQPH